MLVCVTGTRLVLGGLFFLLTPPPDFLSWPWIAIWYPSLPQPPFLRWLSSNSDVWRWHDQLELNCIKFQMRLLWRKNPFAPKFQEKRKSVLLPWSCYHHNRQLKTVQEEVRAQCWEGTKPWMKPCLKPYLPYIVQLHEPVDPLRHPFSLLWDNLGLLFGHTQQKMSYWSSLPSILKFWFHVYIVSYCCCNKLPLSVA